MKTRITLLLITLFGVAVLTAQCDLPNQIDYLNVNDVRAAVMNRGDNFWDLYDAQFKVPYNGGQSASTIFASNLWLGATAQNGESLVVADDYRRNDQCGLFPGPLAQGEVSTPDQTKQDWNIIFSVSGDQVRKHLEDHSDGRIDDPIDDIFGWPGAGNRYFESINGFELPSDGTGMAPFYEPITSRNGIYEPEKGEFPLPPSVDPVNVPGEILFTVFNTSDFVMRPELGVMPFYLEVRQTAWAFNCDDPILDQSVFFHYDVVNRADEVLTDFRFGYWTDFDLGCYTDDFIGCNPEANMAFVYNEDNIDDPSCPVNVPGFGVNPPVQSIIGLGNDLRSFGYYNNPSTSNEPTAFRFTSRASYHNVLNGLWQDGQTITTGGDGYNLGSTDETKYVFPDPPNDIDGWSMASEGLRQGDRRTIAVFDSKDEDSLFFPKQVLSYTLGFMTTRKAGKNNYENVDEAISDGQILVAYYENGFSHCQPQVCDCDCVWPGDTDADGKVDYLDAVNIFKADGQDGVPRSGALSWTGKDVVDWSYELPGGLNGKYVDANGDGSIDAKDIELVTAFLGETNVCEVSEVDFCEEGDDLYWEHVSGRRVIGDLRIERATIKHNFNQPIQGLSFEVVYDPAVLWILTKNSAIHWENGVQEKEYFYEKDESGMRREQVVLFTPDGSDLLTVDDEVLGIAFTDYLELPDRYPTATTALSICNGRVYYSDGQVDTIRGQRLEFSFPDSVITSTMEEEVLYAEIFPNPVADEIQVKMGESGQFSCTLINLHGQEVLSKKWTGRQTSVAVNDLNPGAYILRVQSSDRTVSKKILVQR